MMIASCFINEYSRECGVVHTPSNQLTSSHSHYNEAYLPASVDPKTGAARKAYHSVKISVIAYSNYADYPVPRTSGSLGGQTVAGS